MQVAVFFKAGGDIAWFSTPCFSLLTGTIKSIIISQVHGLISSKKQDFFISDAPDNM